VGDDAIDFVLDQFYYADDFDGYNYFLRKLHEDGRYLGVPLVDDEGNPLQESASNW